MAKIRVQAVFFQRQVWEIEVPDDLTEYEAEDLAEQRVDEIIEGMSWEEFFQENPQPNATLLVDKKLDYETMLIEDDCDIYDEEGEA